MTDTTDIDELITRLEGLTAPCRECDCAIFKLITGDENKVEYIHIYEGSSYTVPEYTASIDAALTLVPDGWHIEKIRWLNGVANALMETADYQKYEIGNHKLDAIAICIAALRATKEQSLT